MNDLINLMINWSRPEAEHTFERTPRNRSNISQLSQLMVWPDRHSNQIRDHSDSVVDRNYRHLNQYDSTGERRRHSLAVSKSTQGFSTGLAIGDQNDPGPHHRAKKNFAHTSRRTPWALGIPKEPSNRMTGNRDDGYIQKSARLEDHLCTIPEKVGGKKHDLLLSPSNKTETGDLVKMVFSPTSQNSRKADLIGGMHAVKSPKEKAFYQDSL